MRDLIRFDWKAFDAGAGARFALGVLVITVLTRLTGHSWFVTGLVALLAWLSNVPGPLSKRIAGTAGFAIGAIAFTLVSGSIGLALGPNVLAIAIVGLVGTLLLSRGIRAYMAGYCVIAWAIYAPFLVETTSVMNCVLAILVGTGVLVVLSIGSAALSGRKQEGETAADEEDGLAPSGAFVRTYAITVAVALALTTYLGWSGLKTDPTLAAGGAFFVIGFDVRKTWVGGFARLVGVFAGALLGVLIGWGVGEGPLLEALMLVVCFLTFATINVHPGAFMFWFVMAISMGWFRMESEQLNVMFEERMVGEGAGVVVALVAIGVLQWAQRRTADG